MEGERKEHDIGSSQQGRCAEVEAGQEGDDQRDLEQAGKPRQNQRDRKADGRDLFRSALHGGELEPRSHREDTREDQPGDDDCNRFCHTALLSHFPQLSRG